METGANMVVNELTQGSEQESGLSAWIDLCMSLAQEILADIDKALSMAQSGGCPNLAVAPPDSPPSPRSPRSEITRHTFKAERTEMISKRRKTRSELIRLVKLGSGPEAEGPLDDGYSWRKYGQKNVLGAKHRRGYYKCTRHSQGCQAKKQMQLSDDNPAIFNVTYSGTHTCDQKASLPAAAASSKVFAPLVTSELNWFSSSPGKESSYGETPSLQASECADLDLYSPSFSAD